MEKAKKMLSQWKEEQMKNRLSKLWFLVVAFIPFLLMFCLHIGLHWATTLASTSMCQMWMHPHGSSFAAVTLVGR